MIITTSETIPNNEISEIITVVTGNTVRAKHIGKDILAGFKGIVGGEIRQYTDLLADARKESCKRMIQEAKSVNADAVVNMRYVTSMVSASMSELLAYGTAVKLKNKTEVKTNIENKQQPKVSSKMTESFEFCYHCGIEIQGDEKQCPHCHKNI